MKNKGFTLVELLSVIVILAIVSLITVPIITNVIESSKKRGAENSAKGYVSTVEKQIVANDMTDRKLIKDGTYFTKYLDEECSIAASRERPTLDSWLVIEDGEVVKYSLKFGDYVVNYNKDNDKTTTKKIDKVEDHKTCLNLKTKKKGTISYGDAYSCYVGENNVETFYVLEDGDNTTINETESERITLIMNKNIKGQVFENSNDALSYLDENTWSIETKLPSYNQISQTISTEKIPKWLYENLEETKSGYWTSTLNDGSPWYVDYNGNLTYLNNENKSYGVRPVITIDKENIN